MSELERVRERLRAQGYLGGRVERFVLRDAFTGEASLRRALRGAAKAATLAAPALAAWTAGTTLAADSRGFRGGDAFALGVYDLAIAWPVCVTLFFVFTRLGAASARRRTPDLVALAVALAGGAGVVWWLAGLPKPIGGVLLWGAVGALCVGLLGWCSGLMTWLGGVAADRPLPERTRRGTVVAGTVAIAAAVAAWAAGSGEPPIPDPSDWTLRPGAPRLTVIGIDGLDEATFLALRDGRETGWDTLLGDSAGGPWTRPPGDSPAALWTSVWTGEPPSVHGVGAADETRLPGVATALSGDAGIDPWRRGWRKLWPGRRAPASTAGRRVRTVWEIVALRGSAAAVGWWASWPATLDRAEGGFVVSDRALAKLEAGGAADRETWPAAYFERLRDEFPDYSDAVAAEFAARWDTRVPEDWRDAAAEAHAIDAFALDQLERLRRAGVSRFHAAYLPGLDILGHRIRERTEEGSPRGLLDARVLFEAHVDWLGARLASLDLGGADEGWLLLADPGRRGGGSEPGFWRAGGAGVRSGCRAAVDDATPWFAGVLHWIGFPVPRDAEGSAPPEVCRTTGPVVSTVAGFPPPPESGARDSAFDEAMLERLRSLGYVQ